MKACSRRWRGAAASAKARSTWPRRPAVRGRGLRLVAAARLLARRQDAPGGHAGVRPARSSCRRSPRSTLDGAIAPAGVAPRLDRRHAVPRSHGRQRWAGRLGRRPRARRHHAPGQAAQPLRHRAGHGLRARRARRRPGGGRPHAQRRLCRERIAQAPGQAHRHRGRADRDAQRPHRLGRRVRRAARRRLGHPRRDRRPDRRRRSRARSRPPSATARS